MANTELILTGFLSILLAFAYSMIHGNQGKGMIRTGRTSIIGNPVFVLLMSFGVSGIALGSVMP